MRIIPRLLLLTWCVLWGLVVSAQTPSGINVSLKSLDTLRKAIPVEKLFLHLDKPNYTLGDTIWFKAYLLDAGTLASTDRSGLLYVELDDAAEKSVKRMMVPVASGVSWGNFVLDTRTVPAGSYTLRAYTNWMRNFGEDRVFKQQLYVSGVNDGLLIAANVKATKQGPKDSIQTSLTFTSPDRKPVRMTDMQFTLMDGAKTLRRYKGTTDVEGKINLNFALADKNKKTFIAARKTGQKEEQADLIIPVSANRPENTDLQFMPEGGNLVAGLPARVGFKAIAENGHGANITGKVYNDKKEEVAVLKSVHKGMGSFEFLPIADETYYAEIQLPNGDKKAYPLPRPLTTGTTLKIIPKGPDSLQVQLGISNDLLLKHATNYSLVAQAQGTVCFAAQINFMRRTLKTTVSKDNFPSGVIRFSLLNQDHQAVNERVIYVDHQDELKLTVKPDKLSYTSRDSVNLGVQVTDKSGKPLIGTFSVAVTDDSQVKADSLANNLISSMLLTADLKGDIEDPNYYLAHNDAGVLAALDNLLLTQGWVGYDWKQVYAPLKAPAFKAEKEFAVTGKAVNFFGKPLAKGKMVLFGKRPTMFLDTLTGDDGRFAFTGISPVDTPSYAIQARNKKGKDTGVGIEMDEFNAPVFTSAAFITTPWYVNTDTTTLRVIHTEQAKQMMLEKSLTSGNVLRNVVINAKKIVKESKNLNGSGEADLVLDEKDLQAAGNITLQELLERKLKGFQEFGSWDPGPSSKTKPEYYLLNHKKIHFIFDGFNVNFNFNGDYVGPSGSDRLMFLQNYLQYYKASDIKGIEVMSSGKYHSPYQSAFLDPMNDFPLGYAFIEITTYGGVGPFLKKTPGLAVYRPIPLSLPKQFYRPKYAVKTTSSVPDQRSTIHWEPNLVTDKNGCANISFYTADKPGKYTIIVQGTDLNGLVGYQRASITVK